MNRSAKVLVLLLVAGAAIVAAALLVLATGDNDVTVNTGGPPPTPAQLVVAQAPATTTTTLAVISTQPTTTTSATTTTGRDPALPYGARHGDQKEIVDEFAAIQQETDCDALRGRRDAYVADEQQMMATRSEPGHRARAEHDWRWTQAVNRQLVAVGCVDLAGTP